MDPLTKIGGVLLEGGAEINAFDAASQKLFVVSGEPEVQIVDFSDPSDPTALTTIDLSAFGAGVNSVTVKDGLVAVAVEAAASTEAGSVVFLDTDGTILNDVGVGVLPDMLTFTPDGSKILVANEGEFDEDAPVDPQGSVSIIDVANGPASAIVTTLDFTAFDGQEADLRSDGVRIFPGRSFSEDAEPEFITVAPDGTQAFVTLQENNAIAVVNLETNEIEGIQPLGLKDFSQGLPELALFPVSQDLLDANSLGTTLEGEEIPLGGLSGLFFEGLDEAGNYQFITHPDRGPDAGSEDVDGDGDDERIFKLPELQPELVRFTLNPTTGDIAITERIGLFQADGTTPLTGLTNLAGDHGDRDPADLAGNLLEFDPLGADLEGVVVNPTDGTFWLVDEYRPAIYHFDTDGVLIDRFVPEGTAAAAGQPEGTYGVENLPTAYATRRANRGFEAVALDTDTNTLYAFIQTPLGNDGTGEFNRETSDDSQVIRILGLDPVTGTPKSEYVYLLQDPEIGNNVDKIGDATYAGDGKFFVIERDSSRETTGQKFVFEIDLTGATNVLDADFGGETLEQQTPDELLAVGVQPVSKTKVTNLPSLGYLPSDKPEGLALLPDGSLAVLNDNDFEPEDKETVLGIVSFTGDNGLDASDRDGIDGEGAINIDNEPVFGFFMPDSIASYEVDGVTYYVTANEGDDRGDADEDAFGDAIRIGDLADVTSFGRTGLALDERFDPAITADEELGRLTISSLDGDLDGDGDLDQLISYSARSFSIWDENGNQVFDSGDQIAQITAELTPELFNANDGDPEEFDTRSDNKGAEPEAVTVGTVGDKTYAFIGLERAGGGALIYDVTDPTVPEFLQYARADEDIAPEGLSFISSSESPTGVSLLAITNEESSTLAVYEFIPEVAIYDIQGEGHLSAFVGETVATMGIVTAVDFNGFYVQDAAGDDNDNTADGLFIFTGDEPTVSIGDEVELTGAVAEFIPGGADTGNLSITQMAFPDIEVLSSGNNLPEAVVIGQSGRVAPTEIVISDDELPVNLQEDPGNFDPEEDAIDFYETLEGMRVTVEDAVAVSPTRVFNEFSAEAFTLPNQGEFATPEGVLTDRGGINLASDPDNTGDQNPERVQIQFDPDLLPDGFETPALNVGDQLGDVTGVVGYSFGNFEVNVTEEFDITPSGLEQEVTDLVGTNDQLTVASYNVLNLSADGTDVEQFALLGEQIANNLGSPDIIALQEIQDDNGVTDDGTVDATQTLQTLVDAIAAAGGPTYEFFDVAPENNTQGGVPGGNIRNAFLYNPDRVSLGDFQDLNAEVLASAGVDDPTAFSSDVRIPLAASFEFNGNTVEVINNHLTSRFGSTPVFGGPQPFVQAGEAEREAQVQALNDFVDTLTAANQNVIVLGDLNTFEFTDDLAEILPGTDDEQVLTNLVDQAIAEDDAYTFIFDGNSQVLDHMFVTDALLDSAEFDIVHLNNDFARDDNRIRFTDTVVASDHEPLVARFSFPDPSDQPPVIVADQFFAVLENSAPGTVVGAVLAEAPDGSQLSYSIVEGNDSGVFSIEADTGLIFVSDDALLDFEILSAFDLTIQVTNLSGASDTETIAIGIEDINEPPFFTDSPSFTISEDAPEGSVVGVVAAVDPDAGQTLSFAIVGGNAQGVFSIDAVTGAIAVADASQLDADNTPTFDLVVDVIDDGVPPISSTGMVSISVEDVDEPGQTIVGDDGNEELTGGDGDDTLAGGLGEDDILGGNGDDILRGDLNSRDAQVGIGDDDLIRGGAGNDRIGGKGGNDTLFGDDGDDQLWGDDGDDILRGGLGNDVLTGDDNSGGQGADTFVLAIGEGTDTITDFEVGTDTLQILGAAPDSLSFVGEQILNGTEVLVILNGVEATDLGSSLVIL
ncbi:MAG: esterase-like activity of phytase family protein [Leptolyngbyaceae cyanobacterium]